MNSGPYSSGQTSANDNNANVTYPLLDRRIRDTYAERSTATLKNSLYDSYIRAIRWASDRIGDSGIIGFVSGSGFFEKSAMDGVRKCLADEFSSIHALNLRGDIRKNMLSKGRAKEGQNIFGSDSMTGIAITLLVKNPATQQSGRIYYHDIGDDLKTAEKLDRIRELKSIAGITAAKAWQPITPDKHGDWVSQRDDSFGEFIVLGDKKGDSVTIFANYSGGVKTNRDAWCYNASRKEVVSNMSRMIGFYNSEVKRFSFAHLGMDRSARDTKIDGFINTDPELISWTRALKQELEKERYYEFETTGLVPSLYRPFSKQWMYYNRTFNELVLQMPRIFPRAGVENRVICVSGIGARSGFAALMADAPTNFHTLDTGQCFPLYLYDSPEDQAKASKAAPGLFDTSALPSTCTRRDAITDEGLAHFSAAYLGEVISKEDLFYYVYGLLHSPEYREKYADNLSKELPRIPAVKAAADFWAYSSAGRALADLHLGYETVPMYPASVQSSASSDSDYRVEKMKYGKKGKDKDLSTLHYNAKITVTSIPLEAYEYIVNGKPALDWVVERQCVSTHKDSCITNDANDWACETMNNPKYPLELFLRVVTVSLETMKIVKALPALDIG